MLVNNSSGFFTFSVIEMNIFEDTFDIHISQRTFSIIK